MKPFPANAYIGEDGNVYSLDTDDNLGPASGFAPKTPPTAPGRIERAAGDGTTLTAGDIRREQSLNAKESGIAATIGALGSAAQMGIDAIPTAMDTRNREQLSKLRTMEAQNRMENRDERVKMATKKLGSLVMAHIERIGKMIERIQSRADKLQEKGVDTAAAEADLAAAKSKLDEAKTKLNALSATAVFILNANSLAAASESITSSKAAFEEVRALIKEAHDLMRSAVDKLKAAAKAAGVGTNEAVQNSEPQQ
jgi:hypothetical protein